MAGETATTQKPTQLPNSEALVKSRQIHGIFKQLVSSHTPLQVWFEKSNEDFSTVVIESNLEEEYFVVDEFIPETGKKRALNGEKFNFRASFNGTKVLVRDNQIEGTIRSNGFVAFKIPFPPRVHYQQRRNAFRITLPGASQVDVKLYSKKRNKEFRGVLVELSASGCRVKLDAQCREFLKRGEQFESCELALAKGNPLKCATEIRHTFEDEKDHRTYCGLMFKNLNAGEQNSIARFVFQMEMASRR